MYTKDGHVVRFKSASDLEVSKDKEHGTVNVADSF